MREKQNTNFPSINLTHHLINSYNIKKLHLFYSQTHIISIIHNHNIKYHHTSTNTNTLPHFPQRTLPTQTLAHKNKKSIFLHKDTPQNKYPHHLANTNHNTTPQKTLSKQSPSTSTTTPTLHPPRNPNQPIKPLPHHHANPLLFTLPTHSQSQLFSLLTPRVLFPSTNRFSLPPFPIHFPCSLPFQCLH